MEVQPTDPVVIFSPLLEEIGRQHFCREVLAKLGLTNDRELIHVVSSDVLCSSSQFASEILAPQKLPNKGPSQNNDPQVLQLPSVEAEAEVKVEAMSGALVRLCRQAGLLAPRATLVCLKEQLQALLLCLARRNKEVSGDFNVDVSDLLAAWNIMKKENFETTSAGVAKPSKCKETKGPVGELVASYASFVTSSRNVDVFLLHRALRSLVAEGAHQLGQVVVVVEGQVASLEWQLLQPLLKGPSCRAYLAVSSTAPLGNDLERWQLKPLLTDGVSSDELFRACFSNADDALSSARTTSCITDTICNTSTTGTVGSASTTSSITDTMCSTSTPPSHKTQRASCLRGSPLMPALKEGPLHTPSAHRTPRHKGRGLETLQYIRQVMVCQVRLLLNTRDELAVAVCCSLPGTALSSEAFSAVRAEAQRLKMPLFQTVVSVVQKRRLGGGGYQLPDDSPILPHMGPLTAFVDHMAELSAVVEDVAGVGPAAKKILSKIKRYVVHQCTGVQSQKCPVKLSSIETVHQHLQSRLDQCLRRFECEHKNSSRTFSSSASAAKLPYPVLYVLQELCDRCTSELSYGDDSVLSFMSLLGDEETGLVTMSPITFTPVRVPSVLTLFRTPPLGDDFRGEEVIAEESLCKRLMKSSRRTPVRNQRHLSCLAWAPDGISPIQVLPSPEVKSPLPSSKDVLASIAALPDRSSSASAAVSPKKVLNKRRKVAKSATESLPGPKRSLLKDISNLETSAGSTTVSKNEKPAFEDKASLPKRSANASPLEDVSNSETNAGSIKDASVAKSKKFCADVDASLPKRSTKRSLLSDISNLPPAAERGSKKPKISASRKAAAKKNTLLAGQTSISSFFAVKPK